MSSTQRAQVTRLWQIFGNLLYSVPIWRANAGRSDIEVCKIGWTSLSPLISCIISLTPRSIPVITAECHGSLLQISWNLKPVKGNRSVYPCRHVVYRIHGTVLASHEINLRNFTVCLVRITEMLRDKSILPWFIPDISLNTFCTVLVIIPHIFPRFNSVLRDRLVGLKSLLCT